MKTWTTRLVNTNIRLTLLLLLLHLLPHLCSHLSTWKDSSYLTVGSHDILRHGLPAFKNDALPVHPVEVIQRTAKTYQAQTKRTLLEKAYGSALPMKMDIERQILSRFQRPPGLLPSAMLGLESLTGELDEFGFEDFLNNPRESETFIPFDIHQGMEVHLGLSKGPVPKSFF